MPESVSAEPQHLKALGIYADSLAYGRMSKARPYDVLE